MNKFDKTRDLVSTLKFFTRLQLSLLGHLEDHEKSISALQETVKRLENTVRVQQSDLDSLRLVVGGKSHV